MAARTATFEGTVVVLATARGLPKPGRLVGSVVVLDIAFASESGGSSFERSTAPFISALGDRLVAWVDHHDSIHHAAFRSDPRFLLTTKAAHGACPELISPELVARVGRPETIVCHDDFDGLASAAKWLLGGREPYAGCDADARAVDTCIGKPGATGLRLERALRARPRDPQLWQHVIRALLDGRPAVDAWATIDEAGAELAPKEARAREIARRYRRIGPLVAFVDVTDEPASFDHTTLLLEGQRIASVAAVARGQSVTFAAPYDSGLDLVARFGLSGGMPTRVSLARPRLAAALAALDVPARNIEELDA